MSHWDNNIEMLSAMKAAYGRGDLVLFLGAGISKGCGLPLWNELIETLFREAHRASFPSHGFYGTVDQPKSWGGLIQAHIDIDRKELERLPAPIQARYCKRRLGQDFPEKLRDALYSNAHQISSTIEAIAGLTDLKAIVTYNYDDLLEVESDSFQSISSLPSNLVSDKTPVYHVHGLIPLNPLAQLDANFVLAEDEYHRLSSDPYHWSNVVQLTLLSSSTCVFLGLSFQDPNLRRLLDIARTTKLNGRLINLIRFSTPRPRNDPYGTFSRQKSFFDSAFLDLGVENFWIDDFEPDIPILLSALTKPDSKRFYVAEMRKKSTAHLAVSGTRGTCGFRGCAQQAVVESPYCLQHEVEALERDGYIP